MSRTIRVQGGANPKPNHPRLHSCMFAVRRVIWLRSRGQ